MKAVFRQLRHQQQQQAGGRSSSSSASSSSRAQQQQNHDGSTEEPSSSEITKTGGASPEGRDQATSAGSSAYDNLKALEEVRLDAEKGMFMFDGAAGLLEKQFEDSLQSGTCAVCRRSLESKRLIEECARLIQLKRDSVQRLRNDEAACLHESCVAAMREIIANQQPPPGPNSSKMAFYLRTGELSEWRQQKIDCMSKMCCFACVRPFTRDEFAAFLKRVDHKAALMERELHVHPKFCTVPNIPVSEPSTAIITIALPHQEGDSRTPSPVPLKKAKLAPGVVNNMNGSSESPSSRVS